MAREGEGASVVLGGGSEGNGAGVEGKLQQAQLSRGAYTAILMLGHLSVLWGSVAHVNAGKSGLLGENPS